MNENCCYYHPREIVIGVCALCLNERLLILLAEKKQQYKKSNNNIHSSSSSSSISLQKVFAIGSLLNKLDIRHQKSDDYGSGASTSQEDSFISIEFEDNKKPIASWEKGTTIPKLSLDHSQQDKSWNNSNKSHKEIQGLKSVMENPKPRQSSLRWRKRIGHLFQMVRWKRSSKGNVCHVSSKMQEGHVKVRHGWIRALTKKTRTKE